RSAWRISGSRPLLQARERAVSTALATVRPGRRDRCWWSWRLPAAVLECSDQFRPCLAMLLRRKPHVQRYSQYFIADHLIDSFSQEGRSKDRPLHGGTGLGRS